MPLHTSFSHFIVSTGSFISQILLKSSHQTFPPFVPVPHVCNWQISFPQPVPTH